jgi:hypothetical protein
MDKVVKLERCPTCGSLSHVNKSEKLCIQMSYPELIQSLKEANDTAASLLNLYTMAEGARIALEIELNKLKSK